MRALHGDALFLYIIRLNIMKIALIGNHLKAKEISLFLEEMGFIVRHFGREGIDKKILRVHKRFISKNQKKSRFTDLFRVVLEENPTEFIKEHEEGLSKEIFSKLDSIELDYLKTCYESFEDFDFIIHIPNSLDFPLPIGPGESMAIGEKELRKYIHYNNDPFFSSETEEIAIIGQGQDEEISLEKLFDELIKANGNKRIFYITAHENPHKDNAYTSLFSKLDEFEKKRQDEFLSNLRAWQSLEDYEKVKIPMPIEPVPVFVYLAGHEVTNIAKLSDQERIFLTCELPDFRSPLKGIENNNRNLKTLAIDKVFSQKGFYYENTLFRNLNKPIRNKDHFASTEKEPGFIELGVQDNGYFKDVTTDDLSFIKECIHYYFQKTEEN